MSEPNSLGAWAAAFLRLHELEAQPATDASCDIPAVPGPQRYAGITPAASALLESIDAGGVPAFVTSNLLQIARDNGLQVTQDWTPNDIVDSLRRQVGAGA